MSFYKLEELRLVQTRNVASAANADTVNFSAYPVPAGKVWCVTGFGYIPDVAETQTVSFSKANSAGLQFGLLNPVSMNLNPAYGTFIEQGMEYYLWPGEYVVCRRVTHTAGSVMVAYMQFVEIDLPLYTYDEPQEVKRQKFALSSIRKQLGGGVGRPGSMVGSAGHGAAGGGGGRGGAEPV